MVRYSNEINCAHVPAYHCAQHCTKYNSVRCLQTIWSDINQLFLCVLECVCVSVCVFVAYISYNINKMLFFFLFPILIILPILFIVVAYGVLEFIHMYLKIDFCFLHCLSYCKHHISRICFSTC